jgi:hypothetical protein
LLKPRKARKINMTCLRSNQEELEIFRLTGVTLHGTAAEHKEANGVVERFNQTLLNMTRALRGRRPSRPPPFEAAALRGRRPSRPPPFEAAALRA